MDISHLLCCPECRSTELRAVDDLTPFPMVANVTRGLRCGGCGREFPQVKHVRVMWSDQVKSLHLNVDANCDHASQVKKANIQVYRDAAGHYDEYTAPGHVREVAALQDLAAEQLTRDCKTSVDVGCVT